MIFLINFFVNFFNLLFIGNFFKIIFLTNCFGDFLKLIFFKILTNFWFCSSFVDNFLDYFW